MQHKSPIERQLFYMQKAKQCDDKGKITETCPDYLYLTQTKILEYGDAFIKNDSVEMIDALADILVCVLGAVVKYKVVPKSNEYSFNVGIADRNIMKYITTLQDCRNNINDIGFLTNCILPQIWDSVIYIARKNNFNIEGALHAVLDNNYARVKKDNNGDFVLQPEFLENGEKNPDAFKVVKIDFNSQSFSCFFRNQI
jgi:hypothetical protein